MNRRRASCAARRWDNRMFGADKERRTNRQAVPRFGEARSAQERSALMAEAVEPVETAPIVIVSRTRSK